MPVRKRRANRDLDQLRARVEAEAAKQGKSASYATRRFSAFEAYTAEASDLLGKDPGDDECRGYASLRLQLDQILEQQLLGKPVDAGDHLRVIEALKRFSPPSEPHKVMISFAEHATGIFHCQVCGARNDIDNYQPPPPKPPQTIDGTVVEARAPEPQRLLSPPHPHLPL